MNVGLPGNVAIPNGLRNTGPAMGEIVDLERYRKLRRRREAEAKKAACGPAPDGGGAEGPETSSAIERAGPGHGGPKGAVKSGDDQKSE